MKMKNYAYILDLSNYSIQNFYKNTENKLNKI